MASDPVMHSHVGGILPLHDHGTWEEQRLWRKGDRKAIMGVCGMVSVGRFPWSYSTGREAKSAASMSLGSGLFQSQTGEGSSRGDLPSCQ